MAEASRVLVVDDEEPLARIIASYLEKDGFDVDLAHDGPAAVTMIREIVPELVVLDIMLPGFDGIEVCRRIRAFTDCYVIMLTARDDEIDKVVGLSVGADDYLVKPFSPRELMARVRAMLRRPRTLAAGHDDVRSAEAAEPEPLRIGEVNLDPQARKVWLGEQELSMTRTEFDVLLTLLQRPRLAFTRRQIIDEVWGPGWYGDEHIVDVHVGHLRRKLEDDAGAPRYIRTVRGVGYGMVTDS